MTEQGDIAQKMMEAARNEPYAARMGIECVEVGQGSAVCKMTVAEDMVNLFGMCHGGAIFSLMDDAFQIACNSRGLTAYALNISVTYIGAAKVGQTLVARASEKALTNRTGTYELTVTASDDQLIAIAQAIAYSKKEAPQFLA